MPLFLAAVAFNHDPVSAQTSALNIRRNAALPVPVPEWRRGFSVRPQDSVAAYAVSEAGGNTIRIRAQFLRSDPSVRTAEIRAVDPAVQPPAGGLARRLLGRVGMPLGSPVANVLGSVKARTIEFSGGPASNLEFFELKDVRLSSAGVGAHVVTWRWQYRQGRRDTWRDFAVSWHTVYSILEVPTAPWVQLPHNDLNLQLPWADVLDYAARWAAGSKSTVEAAVRITQAVNDLGPEVLEYNCLGLGATVYSWPYFDCTAFLERLRGGLGNGRYLNCTDCATIVATFANVLGCDLWQSKMGYAFALNPILAIGSTHWQTACGWGQFGMHEVAWTGDCTEHDRVFDACLHVDGDPDPEHAPHRPLLPANMLFGAAGAGQYRDRLASPPGQVHCQPHPETRVRRFVR